jgi:hypothetical protein
VDHVTFRRPQKAGLLEGSNHPARRDYLARFADWEGREFLRRFYVKHAEAAARAESGETGRVRLAAPRIHPLESWLVRYLHGHPQASLHDVLDASTAARQDAYDWLFKPSKRSAQNRAIEIMLEMDAFTEIHTSWRRQGYPFPSLVPSYATAIGSSGDNPAALSTLMGVIASNGIRYPSIRVNRVELGAETPFDTSLTWAPQAGERMLSSAVASAVRNELLGVVQHGTGRRLAAGVTLENGQSLDIAGKTGTGDNRFETRSSSRVVNRTAAFAFLIGDRFFGSIIAYVPGEAAAGYRFTSALPVQMIRHLLPTLRPLLHTAQRFKRARLMAP